PVTVIVANLFTRSTNRQQTAECFGLRESVGQFCDQFQPNCFVMLSLADVGGDGRSGDDFAIRTSNRGNGDGDGNKRSIFAQSFSVESDDVLAAANFFHHVGEFRDATWW